MANVYWLTDALYILKLKKIIIRRFSVIIDYFPFVFKWWIDSLMSKNEWNLTGQTPANMWHYLAYQSFCFCALGWIKTFKRRAAYMALN